MSKKDQLKTTLEEIRNVIDGKDINLASRKILDLVVEFNFGASLEEKAVSLRSATNQVLHLKQKDQIESICKELYILVDEIERKVSEASSTTSTENTSTKNSSTETDSPSYILSQFQHFTIVEADEITKTYNRMMFRLHPISLKCDTGKIIGAVGENGNGKTTLLRILAGELDINGGTLSYPGLQGKNWFELKQQIAFIPQAYEKWHGKLKDTLHFAAANHGYTGARNEKMVDFIIHRLGLTRFKDAYWDEISSGYKLRFELAKAMVWRPRLLILDEPLANLDVKAKLLFMQDLRLLANSKRYPISIILSSQQLHEIEHVVDDIIFLREGVVMYNGPVKDFGKNRSQNVFEVTGNFDRLQLKDIFTRANISASIDETGQSYLINVPVEITSSEVLSLLNATFKLEYFRDISQSTRILFEKAL